MDRDERGQRARIDRSTGEVHGSGADAGGSGKPREDYDGDAAGGGGAEPQGGPVPDEAAERPREDRHQGTSG